ncbi:hypothetical protein XELAEV_18025443mg [Xenopus laevis]|uniref:Flavin-containing monooxygenase n=1 Tax=Xenopus laevis TaxID=8355 RepID=A0A974HMC3_XENLA|nr:hypothetical protein XELAEV_18025443mg [Xenopus laevis]
MVKNVAVIGAGISGLAAIKSCLEEDLEPTCFERSDDIGGLWRFTDNVEDGRASIYKSLVTNASKELMCLSDFPMPEDFPNFLPHQKFFEYCRMYAEHFKLLKYIRFKTKTNGKTETTIFDAVMICTGQHEQPVFPLDSFSGIKKFKGQIMHCREYKRPVGFDEKQVLIVGMGNTGVDIATELCTKAAKVYLSTKAGVWVIRRLGQDGYPWDLSFITRFNSWIRTIAPPSIVRWLLKKYMNDQFDHSFYGIQPEGIVWKEPLVNEELPSRLLSGTIVIKPGVKEFTETSVCFKNGARIDNLDVVIFATGYQFSFPFLEESVINVDDSKGFLYKKVIPVGLQKPTLAFIGLILSVGPVMVAAELQCRWATRLFKGFIKMPTAKEMNQDLARDEQLRYKWFATAKDNSRQTEYTMYMDDLALQIGMFLTDPVLATKVLFGPCNSYQYRLTGPGKWLGAREAILTQWERIKKPLLTRVAEDDSHLPLTLHVRWFFWFVILLGAVWIMA